MAYKASKYFKGNARLNIPSAHRAGDTITLFHTHVFTEAMAANVDVLELIAIPAGGRVADISWCSEGLTGNASIGFMSGVSGAAEDARTGGVEFASAVANAGTDTKASLLLMSAQGASDADRSISFKNSTAIAASAALKLHVRVTIIF